MRKKIIMLILFCFLAIPCVNLWAEPAANFRLTDLNNRSFTLSDYKNKKPVILLFWTTWCPFCRKEIKALSGRYSQIAADGVEILLINAGENPAQVNKFIRSSSLIYTVLLDSRTEVSREYGVMGIPTYVFINKAGNVIYRGNYFAEKKYEIMKAEK